MNDYFGLIFFNKSVGIQYFSPPQGAILKLLIAFEFFSLEKDPHSNFSGHIDCSGADFPKFKHHIECNFAQECTENEDELGCEYSSDLCQGGVSYIDQCLQLHTTPKSIS